MKRTGAVLSFVALVVIAIWSAITRFWIVPINNPCNTFVSEFAPNHTPILKREGDEWNLMISFTPANDSEASRVYFATWLGERTFEVASTGRRFSGSSHNGLLKIRVASEEESSEVLKALCFNTKAPNPALKLAPSGRWDAPSARPLAPR